ncbi:MAG: helix-turn-helix transcriptional regulator [Gammaproteobacteria bacterium]
MFFPIKSEQTISGKNQSTFAFGSLALVQSGIENAVELLDAVADMHLGNNSIGEWLQRMARLSGADSMCALSWSKGQPQTAICDHSDAQLEFPTEWIEYFDQLIYQVNPEQPELLDVIARDSSLPESRLDKLQDNPLLNPYLIIAYLDSDPARTLLIYQREKKSGAWEDSDRERLKKVLPVLFKSHLIHKRLVLADNRLDMSNKVFDASTRGAITMTPYGEILAANLMAKDEMHRKDGFTQDFEGRLVIMDAKVSAEFSAQLKKIRKVPLNLVETIDWNRSFRKTSGNGTYQLYLRAFGLEKWRLESNAHDRFVTVFIGDPEQSIRPELEQLQNFYDVTGAEAKVLLALFDENDVNSTAAALNVSVNTIRSHLRTLYTKLGVSDKSELVRMLTKTLIGYHRKQRN